MPDEPVIACRMRKRHQHWNEGELVSFPLSQAKALDARKIIEPLYVLVPQTRETPGDFGRGPPEVVRK
jgi:hypothetical protein